MTEQVLNDNVTQNDIQTLNQQNEGLAEGKLKNTFLCIYHLVCCYLNIVIVKLSTILYNFIQERR